jgi:hypothetical protein
MPLNRVFIDVKMLHPNRACRIGDFFSSAFNQDSLIGRTETSIIHRYILLPFISFSIAMDFDDPLGGSFNLDTPLILIVELTLMTVVKVLKLSLILILMVRHLDLV